MTEEEWLTSIDPHRMLEFIRDSGRDRKFRLLACAACRRVWNPFVPPFFIRGVTAAEAFADGEIGVDDLAHFYTLALQLAITTVRETDRQQPGYPVYTAECAVYSACRSAWRAATTTLPAAALAACDASISVLSDYAAGYHPSVAALPGPGVPVSGEIRSGEIPVEDMPLEYAEELATQADMIRDVFGNPFRSFELKLEWLTDTVLALARGMYSSRNFGAMAILADALQDAGCDDEDVLHHCREPREHVRGCWVIDLLLGKS